MTILIMNRKVLEEKIGKVTNKVEKMITDMGTPIEEVTKNEVSIEVFPNRPDLLSLNNFARAFNQFQGKHNLTKFSVKKPEKDYEVTISKKVKKVRPYTACAIVKGLKLDDEAIKELIEVQEKLHNSIGRKRKKVAIGIYPLEDISLPIRFKAMKPEEIVFKALEAKKEMNAKQILKNHPTGQAYAHLLKDKETYPVFMDAKDKILSLVPIINSADTGRVTASTKDVFIECSGHNKHYCNKTLNILIATISEMKGATVYGMHIKDEKEGNHITPEMKLQEMKFNTKDIEKTLGVNLKESQVKDYLKRMGIGYEKNKALVPAYRTDILHWIDLAEEIAIAHGYDNFEAEIPAISTIGEENKEEKHKRVITNILAGTGLLETSSFHLTTKKHIKKMHYEHNNFIEVEDSKTERDVLRIDLLTNLLQILSENSDAAYPQQLFEIGTVFDLDPSNKSETGIGEKERLAIAFAHENVNFTELKQHLDYLCNMLGVSYEVQEVEDNNYIPGRVGKIMIQNKEVGRIGEIAPRVLKNWKIKMPVAALELDLEALE